MAMNSPSSMEKSTPRSAFTCPSSNSRVRAFASRREAAMADMVPLKEVYSFPRSVVNRSIQSSAIAAQRVDRQGSASVQPRRNDNLDTVSARPVFSAAIFQRVAAKRNEADRHVDDELHETVREAAGKQPG